MYKIRKKNVFFFLYLFRFVQTKNIWIWKKKDVFTSLVVNAKEKKNCCQWFGYAVCGVQFYVMSWSDLWICVINKLSSCPDGKKSVRLFFLYPNALTHTRNSLVIQFLFLFIASSFNWAAQRLRSIIGTCSIFILFCKYTQSLFGFFFVRLFHASNQF